MSLLERVFKLTNVDEAKSTYDEWTENYNRDMDEEEYAAPEIGSDYVVKHIGSRDKTEVKILDAGCGTGLVGVHLAKKGVSQVDGIDLSPGMLEVARRTGAYRSLSTADLSQRLEISSESYDIIVCVGTMTQGHVGPEAFDEFVRIVKRSGFIITTVRENVWEKNGYKKKVEALCEEGKVKLVSDKRENVRHRPGSAVVMVVLQTQ